MTRCRVLTPDDLTDQDAAELEARAEALLELTPIGEQIAYDGSLALCTLSSDCECASCQKVFSPTNCRGAERVNEF